MKIHSQSPKQHKQHISDFFDLSRKDIHIWYLDTEKIRTSDVNFYASYLSDKEQLQSSSYSLEEKKIEFILSRSMMRDVLSKYLGVEHCTIGFTKGKYGKPKLLDSINEHRISFNVSHTKGLIVLAVTKDNDIGIDCEKIIDRDWLLDVAKDWFNADEYQCLVSAESSELPTTFYKYWTLKESYLKAVGIGLSPRIKKCSFVLSQNDILLNGHNNEKEDLFFLQFKISRLFIVSVCTSFRYYSEPIFSLVKTVPFNSYVFSSIKKSEISSSSVFK